MQGDREKCLAAGMDDYLAKPILPKDLRAIVERWGSQATPAAPATPASKADAPALAPASKADAPALASAPKADVPALASAPKADVPVPAVEEPPVEMDILNDLTDGNADSLRELVDLFLKQTTQQLEQLEAAVRANKAEDVRRVAHSCAGASATLGMTRFVPLLRKLERQGASGMLTSATQVYEDTAREFKLIQNFLTAQLNSAAPTPATVHL
jgi:HPt (histidine-containing phosphotransfer) domain-containing protein